LFASVYATFHHLGILPLVLPSSASAFGGALHVIYQLPCQNIQVMGGTIAGAATQRLTAQADQTSLMHNSSDKYPADDSKHNSPTAPLSSGYSILRQ